MPLKIHRRPSGIYHIRGTFEGRRVDQSAGTRQREIADKKRAALERAILDEAIHGPRAVVSFAEAALAYMESGGEARFLRPAIELFGTRLVAEIGQAEMNALALAAYPGAAPATINRQVITPVSAVLRFAADQGWRAPPGRVRRRKAPAPPRRWLRVWEAARLVRHAGRYRPLILTALESGCRAGELLRLNWGDVEIETGRLHLRAHATKAGRYRIARFGTRTARALAALKDGLEPEKKRPGEPVFLSASGQGFALPEERSAGTVLQGAFNRISARAGLEPVTPHMLRHTWATWAQAVSKDLLAVRDGGGWASLSMVEVYAKLAPPGYGRRVEAAGWELFGRQDAKPGTSD